MHELLKGSLFGPCPTMLGPVHHCAVQLSLSWYGVFQMFELTAVSPRLCSVRAPTISLSLMVSGTEGVPRASRREEQRMQELLVRHAQLPPFTWESLQVVGGNFNGPREDTSSPKGLSTQNALTNHLVAAKNGADISFGWDFARRSQRLCLSVVNCRAPWRLCGLVSMGSLSTQRYDHKQDNTAGSRILVPRMPEQSHKSIVFGLAG